MAYKRWSIGRTAGRPSVTQASGSHRGRLCRPGAPLEGPHAEFQRIVRVAAAGFTRWTMSMFMSMCTDPATGAKRPRDSPRESPPSESRCRYLSVSSLPGSCSHSELVRLP